MGDGTYNNRLSPVQIGSSADWTDVTAASFNVFARKNDGSLWVWGLTATGGNTWNIPRRIDGSQDWSGAGARNYVALFLKTDGTVWIWGKNRQIALPNAAVSETPIPFKVGEDWATIVPCGYSFIGRKIDGSWWVMGREHLSFLPGNRKFDDVGPSRIPELDSALAIAASRTTVVVLTHDGALWSFGKDLGAPNSLNGLKKVTNELMSAFRFDDGVSIDSSDYDPRVLWRWRGGK